MDFQDLFNAAATAIDTSRQDTLTEVLEMLEEVRREVVHSSCKGEIVEGQLAVISRIESRVIHVREGGEE